MDKHKRCIGACRTGGVTGSRSDLHKQAAEWYNTMSHCAPAPDVMTAG